MGREQMQENKYSEQKLDPGHPTSDNSTKTLQKYKKRLLVQVVTIFTICLVIILERVFYQVIVEQEDLLLSSVQTGLGLTHIGLDSQASLANANTQPNTVKLEEYQPDAISLPIWRLYADLSDFHIQFLILTHVLATVYVAFSAFIAAKVMYVSMGLIYIVSVVQMLYAGACPFWEDNRVLSASCRPSYNHPSLGLILSLLLPAYLYYCLNKKTGRAFLGTIPQKHLIIGVFVLITAFTVQFVNYILGIIYLINIAMSLIFTVLIFMCLIAINSVFQRLLKKSTILKTDAKKYVFYWLLMICLLETFVLIVYSGQDLFLNIEWVQNFMECTKYLEYDERTYRFDEVIGPWFNFVQTASVFAWIGGIFGISACFRKIETFEWYSGPTKPRLYRVLLTNLFIVPSWLFILLLQEQGDWIKDIGLNMFIVDSIHYFILYFWIFGYMPILVLHRGLKLTYKDADEDYVILESKG